MKELSYLCKKWQNLRYKIYSESMEVIERKGIFFGAVLGILTRKKATTLPM